MNSESNKKAPARRVTVSKNRDGQRLDNFLNVQLKGIPRSAIYRIIRTGQVRVNGGRCKPGRKLQTGDEVRIPPVHSRERGPVTVSAQVLEQLESAILYQDADYMVIDKPSGMAVHSGSQLPWGLIDAVRQSKPGEYIELAHRLDRETSGCLLLARSRQALRHFSAQLRQGAVTKRYLCLLDGRLPDARVTVDAPLLKISAGDEHRVQPDQAGKPALTQFRLLQAFDDCSYAEAQLYTGRTHQIRAHAAHLGMPLAGDDRYGTPAAAKKWKSRGLRRLFLHAHHIGFQSPSGTTVSCSSPLPEELRCALERLGG